jgi:hypothetical protein
MRALALAVGVAALLAAVAALASVPAPIVERGLRAAQLLDHDGAPTDSVMYLQRPGVDARPAIRSLDQLAVGLDARLRTNPTDFDALIARARIERLRWAFATLDPHGTAHVVDLPSRAILDSDPRPRILAWLDRAAAVRPRSGEPRFWKAFVYSDTGFMIMSIAIHKRYARDVVQSLHEAREAYRLAPGRRYARALLLSELLELGRDAEAARVEQGSSPAGAGEAQVARLLADRALLPLPESARLEPALRVGFPLGRAAAGPEDASGSVSTARMASYKLATDGAHAASDLERLLPGLKFLHSTPDSAARGSIPMSDAWFGRLQWTPGGQLEPMTLGEKDAPNEPDTVDLILLDWSGADMFGVPRDSVALREKLRTSALYFVDRRRLAP